MPKVSVVIPTYNAERHIEETLQSILEQQDCDFEVLVIDDGSQDATLERVAAFDDPRLRVHHNEVNHGLPGTMNVALSLVRGEYIARIDHDDIALPGRLARQAAFLDAHPEITVLGTQIAHFGMDDYVSDFSLDDASIKSRFITGRAYLANPSAMWRVDFIRQHRIAYDASLFVIDDLGVWFDCMLCGAKFANLPDVLLRYRVHESMTSLQPLDIDRWTRGTARLYKRLLPTYFPRLDGAGWDALIDLYNPDGIGSPERLRAQHRAAGLAISEVDTRYGQDPELAKTQLLHLLNNRRQTLISQGTIDEEAAAELDRCFYAARDAALAEHDTDTSAPPRDVIAAAASTLPATLASSDIHRSFRDAPALCIKHDSYFAAYEALLAPYVGRPITFVEVGVFNGGSLHMWRRYLGEQARIIGIDLNPAARRWQEDGFEIHIGDQSSTAFWEAFYREVGPIDVLLDDGGHMNHQQIVTTDLALARINDGGLLIVEDVHTSYMPALNSAPEHSFIAFSKHLVDAVNSRFPGIATGASRYRDRIWSVSFYESIVAFHIDRRRCFDSAWIANDGSGDVTEDYRHAGISFEAIPDIAGYFD